MNRQLIGVIADTHALIRPEALEALKDADLIIHAGDIGDPLVLDGLRTIAPVAAIRGNTDRGPWVRDLPNTEVVQVARTRFYVIHDLRQLDLDPVAAGFAAVISGHSHQPGIQYRNGVLLLNPGSAGPRRFDLPVSVALIRVNDGLLEPRLIELKVA